LILILGLIIYCLCSCQFALSPKPDLPESSKGSPSNEEKFVPSQIQNGVVRKDQEKALDTAIKLSGKKFCPNQRSMMIRMLNLNEEDLIKGLGSFLKLSSGRYPSSLEARTTLPEAEALLKAKYGKAVMDKEKTKEQIRNIFFASAFYEKLILEKKDVAYYGDKVTVYEGSKVLMRWKIADNKYRTILWDLTVKSVNSEGLSELEKLFSN